MTEDPGHPGYVLSDIDLNIFRQVQSGKRSMIKSALMDQKTMRELVEYPHSLSIVRWDERAGRITTFAMT
jgi:hypothetical protein